MKLKFAYIFFFCFFTVSNFCNEISDEDMKKILENELKNIEAPCRKYWGESLINCMEAKYIYEEAFKKNMLYLDDFGQREYFFENTLKGVSDYKRLEIIYENDQEWQNLWEKFREDEKIRFIKKKNYVFLKHKYGKILLYGGLAISIYSYLMLKLYNAKNYVNKTTTWANFNKNIPIESLYEIPHEKFLADLEVVIYRTFSDDEDKPNYQDTEPLYLFVKAAQKEIKRLEKFVNLYWYCKLPLIAFLFPNYEDELILAQEKIERLAYMQELVTKKLYELHS
jgi:hypothetical protein